MTAITDPAAARRYIFDHVGRPELVEAEERVLIETMLTTAERLSHLLLIDASEQVAKTTATERHIPAETLPGWRRLAQLCAELSDRRPYAQTQQYALDYHKVLAPLVVEAANIRMVLGKALQAIDQLDDNPIGNQPRYDLQSATMTLALLLEQGVTS